MMAPLPFVLFLVGIILGDVGLLLRARHARRYPPIGCCLLLALGVLLGLWVLLNAQFGGQVMQLPLP
ncbi:MAG TPA: hypothetical protein VKX46_01210 [Ktedonobacteraceae bacterium]|jgi:hypothetical protein|nr:hypothetical protein [Ktedonobacteraceae bacterium]